MESSSFLQKLIEELERGNRYHISVLFFGNWGNEKTKLDTAHIVHSMPICDFAKQHPDGLAHCRHHKRAITDRACRLGEDFFTTCRMGVYEYCYPVFRGDSVCCVLFIGNFATDLSFVRNQSKAPEEILQTVETSGTQTVCRRIAEILETYIQMLLSVNPELENGGKMTTVEALKSYAEHSYSQDLSLEYMADVFHYHPKYLGRLFKQQTGESFTDYLNRQRLDRARRLLSETEMNIVEISGSVGYNSVTYFNRLFRNTYKMSPGEYRGTCRKR